MPIEKQVVIRIPFWIDCCFTNIGLEHLPTVDLQSSRIVPVVKLKSKLKKEK